MKNNKDFSKVGKALSDLREKQLESDEIIITGDLLISWKELSLKINNPQGVSLAIDLLQSLGVSC